MIASVHATTTRGEVELIFRVDDDDLVSSDLLTSLGEMVLVGPRGRGYADLPTFFNAMADIASGDLLMCGNDDMRFETVGWPAMLESAAAAYPDRFVNLGVSTSTEAVLPFSCIPRMLLDRLGFINDPRLLWSDVFLRDVFEAFDRVRMVPEVHITHLRSRRPDRTRIEASAIEQQVVTSAYWALHARCVDEAVAVLTSPSLPKLFAREVAYA